MRLLVLLAASLLLGVSTPAPQPAPWTMAGRQQPAAPPSLAPIFAAAPVTAPDAPQAQVSTLGGCTTGGRPARACAPP